MNVENDIVRVWGFRKNRVLSKQSAEVFSSNSDGLRTVRTPHLLRRTILPWARYLSEQGCCEKGYLSLDSKDIFKSPLPSAERRRWHRL